MKTIPRFPKYSISEDGTQCYNNKTSRFIKAYKGVYLTYSILDDENDYCCRPITVHRLVAYAYLPIPLPNQVWVNHKDGNKLNNHYSNLEWTTISENIQHAFDTGLHKIVSGKDHWNYGKKYGKVSRNKMSRKKLGINHPKFKGWYLFKGKRFTSLNEASRATDTDKRHIKKFCLSVTNGWSFLPKQAA